MGLFSYGVQKSPLELGSNVPLKCGEDLLSGSDVHRHCFQVGYP